MSTSTASLPGSPRSSARPCHRQAMVNRLSCRRRRPDQRVRRVQPLVDPARVPKPEHRRQQPLDPKTAMDIEYRLGEYIGLANQRARPDPLDPRQSAAAVTQTRRRAHVSDTEQDATSTPTVQVTARNGVSYAYRRFATTQSAACRCCASPLPRQPRQLDPLLVDAIARTARSPWSTTPRGRVQRGHRRTPSPRWHATSRLRRRHRLEEVRPAGLLLGGFVAQELTLIRPHQIRASCCRDRSAGARYARLQADILAIATATRSQRDILTLFFESTPATATPAGSFSNAGPAH